MKELETGGRFVNVCIYALAVQRDKDVYITMHLAFKEIIKTDKDVYIA